jgi:ABC-type thiamine transport system substrate-binding protein
MKHLIGFLIVIFGGLFVGVFFKQNGATGKDEKPVLRVFGPSSFVSQWGPGPWLKQSFEKTCECRVEFVDGADITILLQRLKSESKNGTDLILGLDQFEIENASQQTDWQEPSFPEVNPTTGAYWLLFYDPTKLNICRPSLMICSSPSGKNKSLCKTPEPVRQACNFCFG